MADCIFCRIVKGEIPAYKIGENEEALAFLDIHPLAKGHILVIPKVHYATLLDIPVESLNKLMDLVKKCSFSVTKALKTEHFNIFQRNGTLSGQAIPHLHFHILPRKPKDGLVEWEGSGSYEDGEAENYQTLIKKFF